MNSNASSAPLPKPCDTGFNFHVTLLQNGRPVQAVPKSTNTRASSVGGISNQLSTLNCSRPSTLPKRDFAVGYVFASFAKMLFSTSDDRIACYKYSREADPFLFAPDSEMWRVNRERCGLIYGPAAAILQLAHPRIAQGVYDHSNFRDDTMGRLRRTLSSTNQIAFGRVSQAKAVRERVAARHRKVRGMVLTGVEGPHTYSAFEPDLLLWVLATLITAGINGYELIYGELSIARKEAFYRDMSRFGTYFGVPESLSPKDWPTFDAYYQKMVEGELLGSHPMCGELARAVVHPQDTIAAAILGRATDFVVIETLPPKVRDRLSLKSTTWTRFRMRLARRVLPKIFPALPSKVRFYPEYLKAIGELRASQF